MACANLAAFIAAAALLIQLASLALAMRRVFVGHASAGASLGAISLLRPVCGLENNLEATLESSFNLDHPDYEIIFCAARPGDAAAPLVRKLMRGHPEARARLLIGDERPSANPKLNNLAKGWSAARFPWIVMADSNIALPRDYFDRLAECWTQDAGLVSSPAVGIAPRGVAAELECAFLNSYEARWQLAADSLGMGFAQGKTMLWRRALLDSAGGIAALGAQAAEDAAATKIVRRAGLKVRLSAMPFAQPLGRRSFGEVWSRQVRWARLRRASFPGFFAPEILAGGAIPLAGAAVAIAGYDLAWAWLPAFALAWYAPELLLAQRAGWLHSWRAALMLPLRDALLPALWLCAWAGDAFIWRGNSMLATAAMADGTSAVDNRDGNQNASPSHEQLAGGTATGAASGARVLFKT